MDKNMVDLAVSILKDPTFPDGLKEMFSTLIPKVENA